MPPHADRRPRASGVDIARAHTPSLEKATRSWVGPAERCRASQTCIPSAPFWTVITTRPPSTGAASPGELDAPEPASRSQHHVRLGLDRAARSIGSTRKLPVSEALRTGQVPPRPISPFLDIIKRRLPRDLRRDSWGNRTSLTRRVHRDGDRGPASGRDAHQKLAHGPP